MKLNMHLCSPMWYMWLYQVTGVVVMYMGCNAFHEVNMFLGIFFVTVGLGSIIFHGLRMYKCCTGGILPECCMEGEELTPYTFLRNRRGRHFHK